MKKKNKKKKVPYSKGELLFNVISLLIAIGIGIYFGGRSFYYYGKQNIKLAEDAITLNGVITNTKVVTDVDGLHQDTDGYYYKGNTLNNYVRFGNRLFRVIRVNNDNTVRVISDDIVSEFMWGEDNSYNNSNLDKWLDFKDDISGSGVYYDTIPNVSDFLVKTSYKVPVFDGKKVTDGDESIDSYITTLSIKDYSDANGKNSYLNIGKYYWILGNDSDNNNLYVSEDGSLLEGNLYESLGVRAVFTFKANTLINGGTGTKEDPYVINQGNKTNLVDSYVKLDNLVWKVYYDKDNILKFAYTNTIGEDSYGISTSEFNTNLRRSIAYRLNNEIYNSFTYKDRLLDLQMFTGEVSSDTSLDFTNIYNSSIVAKVGLLNLFDYHNTGSDNYFVYNTISSVGSNVYVYHNYGLLEEASVTDSKNIIPVVSLNKDEIDISTGDGTINNPYVLR